MMSKDTILKLDRLTKKIGGKTIIDQLSVEVPRGEVFGFLGPNGAGKTTTIRMIVGLMSITDGDVLVHGINIKKNFEEAMQHIGAIVENPEFYKFLSGYRNLLHFSRMIPGITSHRIKEVVELVGLQNRIHDKVKTYSLGMRQRLGVAQAILHKPSLLILDEPTNGLDPAGIRELRDYLRQLARDEGISVLVSSHLLSEMELMCDRVAIIQNGKLIDVRAIRDTSESDLNARHTVLFEVDRGLEAASSISEWASEPGEVTVVEDTVKVLLSREEIPDIIVKLVGAGYKCYSVRRIEKTLEDKFLEVTRGGQIV
jgi:ABC-2 type transport system ATP-binding protein